VARLELPSAWRFVLLVPRRQAGLSGEAERRAFERLPAVPADVTDRLAGEALTRLLPAAAAGDFAEFATSLHRFNRLAGECFAAAQGGPFLRPDLVELLQSWGLAGVGQSSWGPTVFAALPDPQSAERLAKRLRGEAAAEDCDAFVAAADNAGARVEAASR
jgi:predicted sugar kinase